MTRIRGRRTGAFNPHTGTNNALFGKSDDVALYLAVIRQHIEDATASFPAGTDRRSNELVRKQARDWLLKPNAGFEEVCTLAGVEPRSVRNAAVAKIEAFDSDPANFTPRRRTTSYTAFGQTHSIKEWSDLSGINAATLHHRLKRGMTMEQALSPQKIIRPKKLYTYNGESLTLEQWSERTGIHIKTLQSRLNVFFMTIEEALTRPVGCHSRRPKRAGAVEKQADTSRTGVGPFAQESAKLEFSK